MSRVWGVLLGAVLLLAGMGSYLELARRARPLPPQLKSLEAVDGLIIELTPTFSIQASTWGVGQGLTLEVRSQGRVLISSDKLSAPGETIRFEGVNGLSVGENELWCAAYAGSDAALMNDQLDFVTGRSPFESSEVVARGLRIRVGRAGSWWTDQTLWAPEGAAPAGVVRFRIPAGAASEDSTSSIDVGEVRVRRPSLALPSANNPLVPLGTNSLALLASHSIKAHASRFDTALRLYALLGCDLSLQSRKLHCLDNSVAGFRWITDSQRSASINVICESRRGDS